MVTGSGCSGGIRVEPVGCGLNVNAVEQVATFRGGFGRVCSLHSLRVGDNSIPKINKNHPGAIPVAVSKDGQLCRRCSRF
jgi:hypothetical protein